MKQKIVTEIRVKLLNAVTALALLLWICCCCSAAATAAAVASALLSHCPSLSIPSSSSPFFSFPFPLCAGRKPWERVVKCTYLFLGFPAAWRDSPSW